MQKSQSTATEYKNIFGFYEMYRALTYLPRAIAKMMRNNKTQLVHPDFIRRLQLAVTEVNGCPACSYQHTKMALQQGMSNAEIVSFLSGGDEFIKPEEAKGILFAQHFADTRGFPKTYTYPSIQQEYGEQQSEIILSAVQIMLAGNIYGIPFSAFQSRLKGRSFKDSSLLYEVGMLISGVLMLPLAIIHGLLRGLLGFKNHRLDKRKVDS